MTGGNKGRKDSKEGSTKEEGRKSRNEGGKQASKQKRKEGVKQLFKHGATKHDREARKEVQGALPA